MGRILVVAIACIFGAAVTWMFIPTTHVAGMLQGSSAVASSGGSAAKPGTKTPTPPMSEDKRRARAEQLFGKTLKYATNEVRSRSWYAEQDVQVLERAMDECYIVTNMDLYLQHMSQVSDGGDVDTSDKNAMIRSMQPTFRQVRNCANVMLAYADLHNIKINW